MAQRKLRGGDIIEVDDQILRWRQKLRRQEIAIGRNELNRRKKNEKQNAEKRELPPEKRKFFE